MNPIVVATNFTPNSENAAFYAADMALAAGMDIRLVNVLNMPIVAASEAPMPQIVFDDMRVSNLALLDQLAEKMTARTFGKVRIIRDLEVGETGASLTGYCKMYTPFMVVLGTSGHSLENLLSGSTTAKSLHRLHCPILVVPPDARFHTIKKIVVAVGKEDLGAGSLPELPLLKRLSQQFESDIEVVHVMADEESGSEAVMAYNGWKDRLTALSPALHLIEPGDVQQGIHRYLNEQLADWLLVLPKKHGWLEFHKSQAKQLLTHCPIPVITIHEG